MDGINDNWDSRLRPWMRRFHPCFFRCLVNNHHINGHSKRNPSYPNWTRKPTVCIHRNGTQISRSSRRLTCCMILEEISASLSRFRAAMTAFVAFWARFAAWIYSISANWVLGSTCTLFCLPVQYFEISGRISHVLDILTPSSKLVKPLANFR